MELIAEISDKTVGTSSKKVSKWRTRRAARTVLLNGKGEVMLAHAQKFNYYKLPGGGIEKSESPEDAARREALEETGYKIRIEKPLGMIIEYRSRIKLHQISYCFLARTVGKPKAAKYTKKENAERFTPSAARNLGHAILLVKGHPRKDLPYLAKFMTRRDSIFLQKAKESA